MLINITENIAMILFELPSSEQAGPQALFAETKLFDHVQNAECIILKGGWYSPLLEVFWPELFCFLSLGAEILPGWIFWDLTLKNGLVLCVRQH